MTTFVPVHGAFGSAAELAPVIPELEARGHRAIAVDLPCTDPRATLDDYARTVVDAMAGITGPVTVVGHSAGGATVSLLRLRPAGLVGSTRGARRVPCVPTRHAARAGLARARTALARPPGQRR